MPAISLSRPLLAVVALAALLAPSFVLAQEPVPPPPLAMRAEPGEGALRPGGTMNVTLLLANRLDRPVLVAMSASENGGVRVAFERVEVRVPPQGSVRVNATLRAIPEAAPGDRTVGFFADETSASIPRGGAALHARAPYALRILEAAPLPPRLTPEALDVTVPLGQPRMVTVRVENPGAEPRRYGVRVEVPEGWNGSAERTPFEVPARTARPLNLTFTASTTALEGAGTVFLDEGEVMATIPVKLRLAPARDRADAGQLADRVGSASDLALRVDPAEIDLSLGGTAVLDLIATNNGQTPLSPTFELVLPSGIRGGFGAVPDVLEAGATRVIPILLEGDALGEEGQVLEAAVRARIDGAPPATFRVRLVATLPEETVQAASVEDNEGASLGAAGAIAVTAAGVGGVAGLVAWLQRRWPLALAALYTRLKPSSVLAQPLRERIAQAVREAPGVTFGELQRSLGMGAGTLTHHARVLQDAGVLFSVMDGQARRFYVVGAGRVMPTPSLDERALQTLQARGPMRAGDLARELGVSRQALHYHLRRMLKEGRLVGRAEGRELILQAPPATTAPR